MTNTIAAAPPPEKDVTLLDYLLPLMRWRWAIFLGCAAMGFAGAFSAMMQSPYYTATAYFMPSGSLGETDELRALTGASGKRWEYARSASDVVKYYDVAMKARPVIESLLDRSFAASGGKPVPLRDILSPPPLRKTVPTIEQLATGLRRSILIESGGGKILTVSFTTADAQVAADVVNALIDEFVRRPQRAEAATADLDFIRERMEDVRVKLEDKEKEIAEVKSKQLDSGQPDAVRRQVALEREARLLEKSYENLNAEFAKAEIRAIQSERTNAGEIEVLQRAEAPLKRAGPNRRKTVMVFVFIGAVVTSGLALGAEYIAGLRKQFADHPFWGFLRRAWRDVAIMAVLAALLGAAVLVLLRMRN